LTDQAQLGLVFDARGDVNFQPLGLVFVAQVINGNRGPGDGRLLGNGQAVDDVVA
jgi:hypothetical protein